MCPAYPADPKRSLPPVRLRDVHPARWPRPIRAPVNPGVEVPKVLFEVLPVVLPRHPVHSRGSARTDRPVRRLQAVDAHVVQKRGEPRVLVPPCCLAHAIQPT